MFIKFKKVFALIIMLAVFLPALAQADSNSDYSTITATIGNKNSVSQDYTAWTTTDGVLHFAKDTGIHYPYITPISTAMTLTAAQSGTVLVINNNGGTAPNGAIITLPAAAPKLEYTIIVDVNKYIRVAPQSGEIINFSTDVANSKVKNTSTAIGDSIEFFCSTTGQWSVKSRTGTWATDNS